jgi:hypothetical protein
MRETWKHRLADLEAAREMRDAPVIVQYICFVNERGTLEEPMIACGANGFACHRNDGEEFEDFMDRADAECIGGRNKLSVPPPILVLFPSEPFDDCL